MRYVFISFLLHYDNMYMSQGIDMSISEQNEFHDSILTAAVGPLAMVLHTDSGPLIPTPKGAI